MKAIRTPIKTHGGKGHLAKQIVALMPPRCANPNDPHKDDTGYLHYVEPYFGGGSVLLANNPEGISEAVNDLNGWLDSFWKCMANPEFFEEFQRRVTGMPFAEQLWSEAIDAMEDDSLPSRDFVGAATAFFVSCRQSLAGRGAAFAPLSRERTRRGMNEQASAWMSAVDSLSIVHERMRRVVVINRPALDVIRQQDGPRTLYYLDPPYMHFTRATTGEYGQFEMSAQDHRDLLVILGGKAAAEACVKKADTVPGWYATAKPIAGRFMLSGYRSPLYDTVAKELGWIRHDFEVPNSAAGGKTKRKMVESVWLNYYTRVRSTKEIGS